MLAAIALLLSGAVLLAVGAEAAIRGAVRLALSRGVPLFVLGAVLFGVDVESLGATLLASADGRTALAAGTAFGTILLLIAVGFGAALLLSRRAVPAPNAQMVLLPLLPLAGAAIALADRIVSSVEGLGLVGVYLAYIVLVARERRMVGSKAETLEKEGEDGPAIPPVLLLVAGLVTVYLGAALMVSGGERLLEASRLSAGFVGAAVLGALASLDEILLEVLPVLRGAPDLATGNLLGTVAAFMSLALGLAALVRPLELDGAAAIAYLAAATLYTLVAAVFLRFGRAGKVTGLLLLALYALWLVVGFRM